MKSLILLRGLPGSGKSSFAKVISENGKYPVYSVDDYFTSPSGEYQFNFQENHLAYKSCENNTRNSLEMGLEKVIVDNTFTLEWELEPYFKMGKEYGYSVFVMTMENWHGGENIHGIPKEQLEKMANKFKTKLIY